MNYHWPWYPSVIRINDVHSKAVILRVNCNVFYLYAYADSTYFTSLPVCAYVCIFPFTVKASPD